MSSYSLFIPPFAIDPIYQDPSNKHGSGWWSGHYPSSTGGNTGSGGNGNGGNGNGGNGNIGLPDRTYAIIDSAYNLTFLYPDGSVNTVGNVRGPPGATGERGADFSSVFLDNSNNLHFVGSDGSVRTVPSFIDKGLSVYSYTTTQDIPAQTSAPLALPATVRSCGTSTSVGLDSSATKFTLLKQGTYHIKAQVSVTGSDSVDIQVLTNGIMFQTFKFSNANGLVGPQSFECLYSCSTCPPVDITLVLVNNDAGSTATASSCYVHIAPV